MADIKELFDMVTNKTEPDLDSWKEQEDRQRKLARSRKIGAFAVAAVIVVLAAFAVVALRQGDEGDPPASQPSRSFTPVGGVVTHWYLDIATGERTPVEANLTGANLPDVSPNGESVVWFTFEDGVYISALDGSGEVPISPEGLDGDAATWIDDETILFQGRPVDAGENEVGDLYAADVATGEATLVADLPLEQHGAWYIISDVSPDGTTVLYHLPRKEKNAGYDLWTAPIAGGEATLLREDAGFAQYGPDGSVVFLDHPVSFEGDAIWIMDGDGSNARSLVEDRGASLGWPPKVSPDGTKVAYTRGGRVEWVDIATGQVTENDEFAEGYAWYDDDTLIVD